MSIPGDASPLLLGGGAQQYKIERSLRFNSSDSAYLSRTPASAGNRTTWTWSGWLKRSALQSGTTNTYMQVFSAGTGATARDVFFFDTDTDDTLAFYSANGIAGAATLMFRTNAVFRDSSSWYHVVLTLDTTQATAANRFKLYINGSEQTFSTVNYPAQNAQGFINLNNAHYLSTHPPLGEYFSGYLADIHFIDGQALTPSSFAETNITTGQWVPKAYTGTYGTNGFRLAFADNSNNTATTLGKDTSPNGNNWTPTNLSVTAGSGNDSLVDTPTSYGTDTGAGGEVRGNYGTLNPLGLGGGTLSNGNLSVSTSTDVASVSAFAMTTGKWYWEVTLTTSSNPRVGVYNVGAANPAGLGATANGWCLLNSPSRVFNNNTSSNYGAFSGASGNVVMVAYDADLGRIWYGENGTWFASGNPATNVNPSQTSVTGSAIVPASSSGTGANVHDYNFGQRPFAYTAPSGFKALCDTNLPAPVVAKPNSVFDVKLYTGTGSSQTISGLAFSPDLVWTKSRNNTFEHTLSDTVRGANKQLYSSLTNAETSNTDAITAFNSDGFTVGANGGTGFSSTTYVGWAWDAGSSTVTNTQGSITSQVRANASAGFSIVTYTGAGSAGSTVGHGGLVGLDKGMIIIKRRNSAVNWYIGHTSIGWTNSMIFTTIAPFASLGVFNNTAPNSTVFTLGSETDVNGLAGTFVAYCFAPVAGYSSFGSYTGNGSTDGPFVYTGMRVRWLIVKRTDTNGQWKIMDGVRSPNNAVILNLNADSSGAELSGFSTQDFVSNGFKLRTNDIDWNASGGTYIYAAFAENPFQYARAR